jgi:hypothetical protein
LSWEDAADELGDLPVVVADGEQQAGDQDGRMLGECRVQERRNRSAGGAIGRRDSRALRAHASGRPLLRLLVRARDRPPDAGKMP